MHHRTMHHWKLKPPFSDINYQITSALADGCEVIMAGDFNCRFGKDIIPWEEHDENDNGQYFTGILKEHELYLINNHQNAEGTFTRSRNGINSTLDYITCSSNIYIPI